MGWFRTCPTRVTVHHQRVSVAGPKDGSGCQNIRIIRIHIRLKCKYRYPYSYLILIWMSYECIRRAERSARLGMSSSCSSRILVIGDYLPPIHTVRVCYIHTVASRRPSPLPGELAFDGGLPAAGSGESAAHSHASLGQARSVNSSCAATVQGQGWRCDFQPGKRSLLAPARQRGDCASLLR